ncbi:hypothetical protein J6P92_09865 [bacterium]|nr:hypothetical protein [bacterium]
MSIGKVFSKGNIVKYLTRGAGIAALGIVAYDAHTLGKIQADSYPKRKDADACMDTFSNTQYLSSPSMTTAKMKNQVHKWEMDGNIRHFFNSAIGYFRGFGQMCINSVIPLGLGIGACFGKGWWGKGSAIGLGLYAGLKFFKDVLGFGHYNDLNRKY